jgi:pimeloyl-ACP methyl ester carboxylesterase
VSRPSRNQALLAAGFAGVAGTAGWLTARRTAEESAARRARGDSGRPLSVVGSSGGRIHARVHGPDDAPSLVLVHCWTGTQELWHKQVAALAGELRIVTYDHRGHGLSDPAPDRDYSLAALAADLDLVLDAGVPAGERPILAGHSMGAMTIAAWADAHAGDIADLAAGAALISTGLDSLTAETSLVRPLPGPFETVQGRIADSVLESPFSIQGVPVAIVKAAAAYAALAPGARDEDVELTTRMALDCRTRARAGCGRAMARMKLSHVVDELTIPTIVIAGERDLMTPIAHAERIETALPHSLGLRVDPNAGHMTPLESPELVNDALRELAAAVGEGSADSKLAA